MKGFVTIQEIKRKKKDKKKRGHPKTFLFFDSLCSLIQKTSNTDSAGVIVPENSDYTRLHLLQIRESRLNKIHSGKRLRRTVNSS